MGPGFLAKYELPHHGLPNLETIESIENSLVQQNQWVARFYIYFSGKLVIEEVITIRPSPNISYICSFDMLPIKHLRSCQKIYKYMFLHHRNTIKDISQHQINRNGVKILGNKLPLTAI